MTKTSEGLNSGHHLTTADEVKARVYAGHINNGDDIIKASQRAAEAYFNELSRFESCPVGVLIETFDTIATAAEESGRTVDAELLKGYSRKIYASFDHWRIHIDEAVKLSRLAGLKRETSATEIAVDDLLKAQEIDPVVDELLVEKIGDSYRSIKNELMFEHIPFSDKKLRGSEDDRIRQGLGNASLTQALLSRAGFLSPDMKLDRLFYNPPARLRRGVKRTSRWDDSGLTREVAGLVSERCPGVTASVKVSDSYTYLSFRFGKRAIVSSVPEEI
jgi:hypothetical protein